VREVETVPGPVEHAAPHQLFDSGGGLAPGQAGSPLQQAELELTTDHCRHRRYLLPERAESVQAARDQRSDTLDRR